MAKIPPEWGQMLWEYRGDRKGAPGMEVVLAGSPRGCFGSLADDDNLAQALEYFVNLHGEISYVVNKYGVDSWSAVFRSC